MPPPEWLVIGPGRSEAFDGIADFSIRLTSALSAHNPATLVDAGSTDAPWQRDAHPSAVFLQFAPHLLRGSHVGALLRWLRALAQDGVPIVVTLHELWPPPNGTVRRLVSRALQRRRVRRVCAVATELVCAQGRNIRDLRDAGLAGDTRVTMIPVGSNIERADVAPLAPRSRHTVTLFGQPAAMHAPTLVALAQWLDRRQGDVTLRWLNRSAGEARQVWAAGLGLPVEHVEFLGGLDTTRASAVLASGDVALAPYVDGVSTRRTTLSAHLQHGRPVVGTDGESTDDFWRHDAAIALVPMGRASLPEQFVARVEAVLDDPARRAAMGAAALRLFDAQLSWSRIGEAYVALVSPDADVRRRV